MDVEYLQKVVEMVKENPELGKTIWRSSTKWKGGLVEGNIDLPGFLALESPEKVWPGFTDVSARVFLKTKAPLNKEELQELNEAVIKTSPVGSILKNQVKVTTELEPRRFV